jgi:ribosome biogenesis GTPase / thiamine phosphate phosphatase
VELTALGWTPALAEQFAALGASGAVPGRIALEHTHIYRVYTEAGEWLARVSGRLRHRADARVDFPAVGDWVAVEPPVDDGDARIVGVVPRFSRFSRRAAGDPTEEQIVAANIDVVFVVSGLDGDFNPRRIERYLVVAWDSGATPVVVLNKADLVSDPESIVGEVQVLAPAVGVHAVSCRVPGSLDPLRDYLGFGKTGALLGSSGVGKSSIVNALVGHDLLATRAVRESDSRGRHTSAARQLVMLPDHGIVIDTPGMRELQLWETGEAIGDTFSDIEARATECRFRDCQHRTEPGCAVRAAVAGGEIPESRLASFHKLADEQAFQARQQDARALIEEKRRGRIGSKALQARLKDKGRL